MAEVWIHPGLGVGLGIFVVFTIGKSLSIIELIDNFDAYSKVAERLLDYIVILALYLIIAKLLSNLVHTPA